jgi:hypothetical protein
MGASLEALLAALEQRRDLYDPEDASFAALSEAAERVRSLIGMGQQRDTDRDLVDPNTRAIVGAITNLGDQMREGFDMLGGKIDAVGAKVDGVGAKVDEGFETLGGKIDAVGAKVDGVGVKVDEGFETLGGKIDRLGRKLGPGVNAALRVEQRQQKPGSKRKR